MRNVIIVEERFVGLQSVQNRGAIEARDDYGY